MKNEKERKKAHKKRAGAFEGSKAHASAAHFFVEFSAQYCREHKKRKRKNKKERTGRRGEFLSFVICVR